MDKNSTRVIDELIAVLSIPKNMVFYNQDEIAQPIGSFAQEQAYKRWGLIFTGKHVCNTEACLAGWIYYNEQGSRRYKRLMSLGNHTQMFYYAVGLFRLKDGTPVKGLAHGLFDRHYQWPKPFCQQYKDAVVINDFEALSKVVVARLEFFKRTGK